MPRCRLSATEALTIGRIVVDGETLPSEPRSIPLGRKVAARHCGMTPGAFTHALRAGEGPPCAVLAGKPVFAEGDLNAWLICRLLRRLRF